MKPLEALGLPADASPDAIRLRWKELAKSAHPDTGGSSDAFHDLQAHYLTAMKEAENRPCPKCDGEGKIIKSKGFHSLPMPCPSCKGSGKAF